MKNTWIMLANETLANIYSVNKDNIQLIDSLQHSDSRLQDREIASDRAGKYNTFTRGGTGKFVPATDQHTLQQQIFSRQIGEYLDGAYNKNQYEHLVICAEPHFYGMIKKELSSNVWHSVTHHILRDYIPFSENKIKEVLKHLVKSRFQEAA